MTVEYFHQLAAAASVKLLDSLNRCKTLFRDDVFIPVTIYFSLSLCSCGSFSRLKYCGLATTLSSASLWTQSQNTQVIFPTLGCSLLHCFHLLHLLWKRARLALTENRAALICCWFDSNIHKLH